MKKKLIVLVLIAVIVIGCVPVSAKEIPIPTPKISIKVTDGETGIKLTIKNTKDADGYEVYATFKANNSLYTDGKTIYCNDNFSCKDKLVQTATLYGTNSVTVTLKAEELVAKMTSVNMYNANNTYCRSLPAGKYSIKVRLYNDSQSDTVNYGNFSKSKTLTIKQKKTGSGYKTSYDFSGVKEGDTIRFGAYEQDGNFYNGQEPIEWIVLEKKKSQVFVVSKYALDNILYNTERKNVTWETCTLRKWLNDNFINAAFNKTEKGLIKSTNVVNSDNAVLNSSGGKNTTDKVFLLSLPDVIEPDYGFVNEYATFDEKRKCVPSNYAISRGTYIYTWDDMGWTTDGLPACNWWLRTPGESTICAGYVNYFGRVYYYGDYVNRADNGVRPAMWISIKSK